MILLKLEFWDLFGVWIFVFGVWRKAFSFWSFVFHPVLLS